MKKLRIAVIGHAGVGKTAIAQLIAETLLDKGFEVQFDEPEHPPRPEETQNWILDNLKNNIELSVGSVQARRTEKVF